MNRSDRTHIFCTELWQWFSRHKRTLPWRDINEKNLDHKAYLILVSEVMLQQTQVSRVVILYKNFIQQFPHIEALSKASNREILIAWRGLGYNNRALRLRDSAKTIVEKHHGKFPREMRELQDLPGVGHYTAGAIRNFAFGLPTPCIDVNIRRILHRFFVGPENPDGTWKKDERYLLTLAEEVLSVACPLPPVPSLAHSTSSGQAGGRGEFSTAAWHAALMDFGSLICTKNSPKWELMSKNLKSVCASYGKKIQVSKVTKRKEPGRMMAGRFIPNRIFRGKIVEALRDADKGLTLEGLGKRAIADWTMGDQRVWLLGLLEGLQRDGMIEEKQGQWRLKL